MNFIAHLIILRNFATNLEYCMVVDTVYEKLLEQLNTMTPEQLDAEWEELEEFNFGPTMDEYEQILVQYKTMSSLFPMEDYYMVAPYKESETEPNYYLAA